MRNRWKKLLPMALGALAVILAACLLLGASDETVALQEEEIREAQRQLSIWGYYTGEVDGVNGAGTRAAVRAFQRQNGLQEDGQIAGVTAELLGLSPTGSRSREADSDVYLLAQLVHAEVGDQPFSVQAGVAALVLNRVADPAFPNSVAAVIYQSGAFASVEEGRLSSPPGETALRAARDAMNGWDPTGGSTFYSRTDASPAGRTVTTILGEYKFYQ